MELSGHPTLPGPHQVTWMANFVAAKKVRRILLDTGLIAEKSTGLGKSLRRRPLAVAGYDRLNRRNCNNCNGLDNILY